MHAYGFVKIFLAENQFIVLNWCLALRKNGMQAYFFSGVSGVLLPGVLVGLASGLLVGDVGFSG